MKVPLRYQITNYDCGPTCLLNGLSVLLERDQIPPEVMKQVTVACMDQYGDDGSLGRKGTSHAAMRYMADWLDRCGRGGKMPLRGEYLTGRGVGVAPGSRLREELARGGVATARIDLDGWHYILLTGTKDEEVYVFDPWKLPEPFPVPDVKTVYELELLYNRIVPLSRFESTDIHPYSFGPYETREAVLMTRTE